MDAADHNSSDHRSGGMAAETKSRTAGQVEMG